MVKKIDCSFPTKSIGECMDFLKRFKNIGMND